MLTAVCHLPANLALHICCYFVVVAVGLFDTVLDPIFILEILFYHHNNFVMQVFFVYHSRFFFFTATVLPSGAILAIRLCADISIGIGKKMHKLSLSAELSPIFA